MGTRNESATLVLRPFQGRWDGEFLSNVYDPCRGRPTRYVEGTDIVALEKETEGLLDEIISMR